MLTVTFFCFFLLVFWLENVLGIRISTFKGISLLNIALYSLLISWMFNIIQSRKLFNPGKINYYLLILSFVVLMSIPVKIILNEIPFPGMYQELIYFKGWLNPILLFFVLYNTLDNKKYCKLALNALLIFFAITVISSIAEIIGIFHAAKLKVAHERSAGFAEPNQYAAYLVLFLPLLFSGALFSNTKKKIFSVIFIFLTLISMLITGSRGGIISLFCACIFYFYLFSSRKFIKSGKIILIILLGIPLIGTGAFWAAPENVRNNVLQRFNPAEASNAYELTSGRTVLWANCLKLYIKSPIVGHGQNTVKELMKKKFPIWGNSHNDYLLYMVHYGIIGLILFLLTLGSLFKESWGISIYSQEKHVIILSLSYLAGLFGFVVAMFGVNIIQPLFLFWAYSAIILRLGQLSITDQKYS